MKQIPVPLTALIFTMISMITVNTAWANDQIRSVAAGRTDTPPKIDGRLDDACWSTAWATTDFIEHKTEKPAQEQTIVRVLYDNTNLYVAFECIEPEPNQILATKRKYDRRLENDDWVDVRLDTFHDHRCNYAFMTNALGTRYDARVGPFTGGRDDPGDTWNGRVKLTTEETSEDRNNLTLPFSWPIRDNIDLYMVLNNIRTDGHTQRGTFTKLVYHF